MQNMVNPVVLLHGFDRCSKHARDRISLYIFMLKLPLDFISLLLIVQLMFRMEIHIFIA